VWNGEAWSPTPTGMAHEEEEEEYSDTLT